MNKESPNFSKDSVRWGDLSMPRPNYGPEVKKRAKRIFEALLRYVNHELDNCDNLKIQTHWQSEKRLVVRTKLRYLEALTELNPLDKQLSGNEIKEAFARLKDLGLLEDNRVTKQGSDSWHFTFNLWHHSDLSVNLRCFDEEWEQRRSTKSKASHNSLSDSDGRSDSLDSGLDTLVQFIREKVYDNIKVRCAQIRVLDMSQPIVLDSIYATVNIYESISGRQRRELNDVLQRFNIEEFDHLSVIQEAAVPGVDAVVKYSKLMVFGKPGAGKTAFLKWLAIQCNEGYLWNNLVPVFITLKSFAESREAPDLLSYINNQWIDCAISKPCAESLLKEGRVLLLLDGLDEVRENDYDRVLKEIHEFSIRFHSCLFVATCRIAARDYTFEQFTEVEIADFNEQQIIDFVSKWFSIRNDASKSSRFLDNLSNQRQIRDLASNPLLLTLLCIVFQEAESFPSNRADLYHEGLEVLLKTWDSKRNIARDTLGQNRNLYQELSLQNKEALLGYLAFTTFQTGNYFFKQKTIEQHISDFLRASHIFSNGLECVEIDAKLVLKAIEAQHGILVERARGVYSFSHLTFHEYFTAKQIADCYQVGEHSAFSTLVSHICDQEWNEVFLLTITMLRNADILIAMMKAKIDSLINTDQEIKKFLRWLGERAVFAINNPTLPGLYYKPAIVRSYHSFLLLDDVDIKFSAISIGSAINQTSEIDSPVMNTSIVEDSQKAMVKVVSTAADNERAIAIAIVVASSIHDSLETVTERTVAVTGAIDKAIELTDDSQLKKSLSDLRMQLPPISNEAEVLKDWWQNHGFLWISHLKDAQIKFRHLEHNFRFSYAQIELLQRYYRASLLLINCLNTECCVSTLVRDEVEASLLLPPADIEY